MHAAARADEAARSVLAVFDRRPLGLPWVRLGAISRPGCPRGTWHYWWQAHLVDCLLDAGRRSSPAVPPGLVRRHLAGIWVRNGLRYRNGYFDDMAWLALAAQRAGYRTPGLRRVLLSAVTGHVGGGAFWSTNRDFKNAAATAPIALYLARLGERAQARELLGWLRGVLAAPEHALLRDGIRLTAGRRAEETVMEEAVFTYNQGPVLGVMLEVGGAELLKAAQRHIDAIAAHLTHPGTRVLVTHGAGDGGLFTGILTRYLGLASRDERLEPRSREVAMSLVRETAANLWDGRVVRGWRDAPVTLFPGDTNPGGPGGREVPEVVELSTQLQAWMALEATVKYDPHREGLARRA